MCPQISMVYNEHNSNQKGYSMKHTECYGVLMMNMGTPDLPRRHLESVVDS